MLGCHDFCGYYDWTFHYRPPPLGPGAVRNSGPRPSAAKASSTTPRAPAGRPARPLRQWTKTGEEESCDWTFTLDEAKNVLRWDMRECPSKGFLLAERPQRRRGLLRPLHGLDDSAVGAGRRGGRRARAQPLRPVLGHDAHEDRPAQPLEVEADIRRDPRWNYGYLHRWENDRPQPLLPSVSPSSDPCDVLAAWFAASQRLTILGPESAAPEVCRRTGARRRGADDRQNLRRRAGNVPSIRWPCCWAVTRADWRVSRRDFRPRRRSGARCSCIISYPAGPCSISPRPDCRGRFRSCRLLIRRGLYTPSAGRPEARPDGAADAAGRGLAKADSVAESVWPWPAPPSTGESADFPAPAIFAPDQRRRLRAAFRLHFPGVPAEALADPQGQCADQHDFGQRRCEIDEVAEGRAAAFAGLEPFQVMVLPGCAGSVGCGRL